MTEYFAKEAQIQCPNTNETAIGYLNYLKTEHWNGIRAQMIKENASCSKCGKNTDKLQVHHLTYDSLGRENIDADLCLLCKECHDTLHGRKARILTGIQYIKILNTAYPIMANSLFAKSEQKILWILLPLLQFGSNECRHKNQKPVTAKWLTQQTKLNIDSITRALRNLESDGFISRVNKSIYINPYFALRGKNVDLKTRRMFIDTEFYRAWAELPMNRNLQ